MKRHILHLIMLAALLTLCTGCGNDNYNYNIFGSISGTVTDNASGEPVPAAIVTLVPSSASVQTASDGKFEFSNLEAGQYTISVQKDGYQSNRKNLTVTSGETVNANITLAKISK